MATFTHSTIGKLQGNSSQEGVVQFLGLQYATLTDRFAPAKMKEYIRTDDSIDATRIGPQVPSIASSPDAEFALIQHKLDYDHAALRTSDTDALCLNITVPAGALDPPGSNLPVFAFIHGGGFNVGSAAYPQYDMARFVRRSVDAGTPVIAASMNYRLGAPGLLTSTRLRARGYLPNNTLRDQRTALLWLRAHIAGFGGDAGNVTLAGESAGGISVCYHLFSAQPLFRRMLSMSGTQLLMPPLAPAAAEANYQRVVRALGLGGGEKAVEALTTGLQASEMLSKLTRAGMPFVPVVDDDLCPTTFDFESIRSGTTSLPGHKWCEAAIVGDCQFDGNIQGLRLGHRKKGIASAFCSSMSASLAEHPGLADRLFTAYALSPSIPDDEAFEKVLTVANDLNFYLPTLALAENLSTAGMKTYMWRFNEPNPWDGPWKGHAVHILDVAFLLQNFNEFLDASQRETAERFAEDVLAFVNGEAPWEEWRKAKVFGPQGRMEIVDDVPGNVGRRDVMLELGKEVGIDTLNDAFDAFMKGAKPPHAS